MIGLQVWNVFIKQKTEKMKKENELKEKDLNKMREDLRKEMLEELRKENPNLNDTIEKVETNQKPEVHISTDEIDKK